MRRGPSGRRQCNTVGDAAVGRRSQHDPVGPRSPRRAYPVEVLEQRDRELPGHAEALLEGGHVDAHLLRAAAERSDLTAETGQRIRRKEQRVDPLQSTLALEQADHPVEHLAARAGRRRQRGAIRRCQAGILKQPVKDVVDLLIVR